jgi:hypothetical protein
MGYQKFPCRQSNWCELQSKKVFLVKICRKMSMQAIDAVPIILNLPLTPITILFFHLLVDILIGLGTLL